MANGVLPLLRDIYKEKEAHIEHNYYQQNDKIISKAKKTKAYQQLQKQIDKLHEQVSNLEKEQKSLVPESVWDLKEQQVKNLKDEYLQLRIKTTLNGISQEEVKKLVEDFNKKDFMGN